LSQQLDAGSGGHDDLEAVRQHEVKLDDGDIEIADAEENNDLGGLENLERDRELPPIE